MFLDNVLDSIKEIIKDKKVYLVGGYLRNYFLNNKISFDRDLVVLGDSKALAIEISEKLNGTFIELDSENEIYRVVLQDKINYFDISKMLNNSLKEDIKRRDFTINSIFYDLNENKIIDLFNGVEDIKRKVLRTIDFNNFIDDPLRFLRLYRFFSLLGFKIEEDLSLFVKNNFNLIKTVAKERINYEIIKIFEGEFVVETLLKMYEDGILELIFPFVKEIKRIPNNSHHHLDLIHHSIETVKQIKTDNPILKIAAFYHDIGKPSTWTIEPVGRHRFIGHDIVGAKLAQKELEELKFSNKQISYISKMIKYHIYPASLINSAENKKAFARFVRKLGIDTPDIIALARADRLSALGEAIDKDILEKSLNHLDELQKYYDEVKELANSPKSLLDGREIMEILNLKPSKVIGEIIEEIKENQLSGDIKTKEEAIIFIKNKAAKGLFNGTKN
ncbi:MAG: HDIG domain-containing protein [Candidatus Gastranaerophilales bacterium]|nr:HDIG domain-containing protein [Candidatus Gastranaerophilales bacterium]